MNIYIFERVEKMNYEKTIPSQRMPSLSDSSVSDGGSLVHLTTLRMGRRAQDQLGLDNSDIPDLMEEFDQSMMRMLDPALQSDAVPRQLSKSVFKHRVVCLRDQSDLWTWNDLVARDQSDR